MEECLLGRPPLGWVYGIMMTYNYRLMHTDAMRRAVDACARARYRVDRHEDPGRRPGADRGARRKSNRADVSCKAGHTQGQARLKAVWETRRSHSICSQMPSMALLAENTAAAVNKTKLSALDREALNRHAQAGVAGYCAGCTGICEPALTASVPVGRVMRYLMYGRNYGNRDFARSRFRALPAETSAAMARLDYTTAEARCPEKMPIGRLMREALLVGMRG